MSSPSHALAEKIIERLVKEKLLSEANGKKMLSKLADGSLRAEDWRLPFETKTEQETKQ